jgi:chromosome segregation ATPase
LAEPPAVGTRNLGFISGMADNLESVAMDYSEWQWLSRLDRELQNLQATANQILKAVNTLQTMEGRTMATVQDVINEITAERTVEDSVVALLDAIQAQLVDVKAQLAAGGTDASALDAVIASLKDNEAKLTDAVTRNTPAA